MLRLFSRRFPFPDYLNASSVELFRGESAELSFLISSRLQPTGGDLKRTGRNWGVREFPSLYLAPQRENTPSSAGDAMIILIKKSRQKDTAE